MLLTHHIIVSELLLRTCVRNAVAVNWGGNDMKKYKRAEI